MTSPATVIVGASVAGVRTAQALRAANYAGKIILLSEECITPYDKPPLSKGFLAATAGNDEITLLTAAEAAQRGIDLRLRCRAARLHLDRREVELASGARVGYQCLVVATGARARPSPWGQPPGLHVLRTLGDAQRLGADMRSGGRLIVIGGGFIGAEIASTARTLGLVVMMVDPSPAPMARLLGAEIGAKFTRLHQRNGVKTMFGVGVQALSGERGAFRVGLTDGTTVDADLIVVGIGATPNVEWLADSGLRIDDGVVCNQYCQAVDEPDVFAVGDVARWLNPRRNRLTRNEHWTNAAEQSTTVAYNITHPSSPTAYAPVEYVWSDQYDWKIRIAGEVGNIEGRQVEVIGEDATTGRLAALYSSDGENLSGIVVVNWPKALVTARKALNEGLPYAAVRESIQRLTGSVPLNAGSRTA